MPIVYKSVTVSNSLTHLLLSLLILYQNIVPRPWHKFIKCSRLSVITANPRVKLSSTKMYCTGSPENDCITLEGLKFIGKF